ncbi:MAG: uncharacterized protein PWP15_685 [Methanothermococcus sp.]|jgi:hypothetical protein|uniref:type II toxin-antitoxin system VapC family toxin n=1 Tax=Methanothermococcus TaxID=155862 RepID=UPI0003811304|nr:MULTISPECIES: PIN domain-containing protein [Methanothermococcus]MDK2790178.1 uncharacterized protein [Methanothermococcus sp.]MDK2987018.1 uncharacterized protein [Methanothermococcus sp.]
MTHRQTTVIPDTNFLIYLFKHRINFDYELSRVLNSSYEVVILECIVEELKKLKKELKGSEKLSANLALKLIERYRISDYDVGSYADEKIMNYAMENENVVVCTNDKNLKRKLLEAGIPIIIIKQKNHFELQGTVF